MTDTEYVDFLAETALVWDWPIAVYLFLLGISVGMVALTILFKRLHMIDKMASSMMVKATAIIAPLTVVIGLLLLIFHLTLPWMFWRLLIFYQFSSVMSIGVMLFQIYFVLLFGWLIGIFYQPVNIWLTQYLPTIQRILPKVLQVHRSIETGLLVIALLLGAYTGFLLSALKTYPMLNNPVLPILFLFSGLSSGIAAITLTVLIGFKQSICHRELSYLHRLEAPVVGVELFLLAVFFIGLYFAGGQKSVAATTALFTGGWSAIFWFGVVGIGMLLPLFGNTLIISHISQQQQRWWVVGFASLSLLGTLLLRLFVLYAGQMRLA